MGSADETRAALVLGAVGVRRRAGGAAAEALRDQAAAAEAGPQHAHFFGFFGIFGGGRSLLPRPLAGGIFGISRSFPFRGAQGEPPPASDGSPYGP
jgi:hypothetical protein